MNINYHYHAIKTLALKAEFGDFAAQKIAYYSQMVDDFDVLPWKSYTISLKEEPPAFFFEHGVAGESVLGGYWFRPVTTEIKTIDSITKSAKKFTITPFHFIPTVTLEELERQNERRNYRCKKASECDHNSLIQQIKQKIRREKRDLMRIGMFLHTYADTYAHQEFSGMQGEENYAFIESTRSGMSKLDKYFYYDLPSIGHANVGHLPDAAADNFTYARIPYGGSGYTEHIIRDNVAEYELCSRDILDFLCDLNGQPHLADEQWGAFYQKIKNVNEQVFVNDGEIMDASKLNNIWNAAFQEEGYTYNYDKNAGDLSIKVKTIENVDMDELRKAGAEESDLYDIFSEKGKTARSFAQIQYQVNEDFFQYNQLAYEHIAAVHGKFPSFEDILGDVTNSDSPEEGAIL